VEGESGTSPCRRTQLASLCRRGFRKLIYRRTVMARYEVKAGESRAPGEACPYEVRVLDDHELDLVAGSNPHLSREDLEDLRQQTSSCLVVLDGDRVAASSWLTHGRVRVHELERVVHVPPGEHFSCRSYVDPEYRGRSLHRHMLHAKALQVPPEHTLWCLVYDWNVASIRSLEAAGWRRSGRCWTRFLFTRRTEGHELMPVTADPPGQGTRRRAH